VGNGDDEEERDSGRGGGRGKMGERNWRREAAMEQAVNHQQFIDLSRSRSSSLSLSRSRARAPSLSPPSDQLRRMNGDLFERYVYHLIRKVNVDYDWKPK